MDPNGSPDKAEVLPPSGKGRNPGTIEELHKQCQSVFPMYFEGAKLLVNKGLSNNFQVSHTLTFSGNPQLPSGYRFGATYVGSKMMGPSEAYPLMLADIDPSGNLNANIIHAISERLKFKFVSQIQKSKWQSVQMSADYKGDLYSAALTLGNPDLIHGSGVAVLHYLRGITKNFSLGGELAYQANPSLPGGHMAVVSLAAKYETEDSNLALTAGNSGQLHASFYQKCSPNLQIGVEMETNMQMKESNAAIGYEVDIAKGNFLLRGSVDSNFVVKSVLEKKLLPLPFTLALCSLISHRKNQFQFGCGLIIG